MISIGFRLILYEFLISKAENFYFLTFSFSTPSNPFLIFIMPFFNFPIFLNKQILQFTNISISIRPPVLYGSAAVVEPKEKR